MKINTLISWSMICMTVFLNISISASHKEMVDIDFLPTPGMGHAVRSSKTGALLQYIPEEKQTNPVSFEQFFNLWQQEQTKHKAFEKFVIQQFLSVKKQLEHLIKLLDHKPIEDDPEAPMIREHTQPEIVKPIQQLEEPSAKAASLVLPVVASAATNQTASSATKSENLSLTQRLLSFFQTAS